MSCTTRRVARLSMVVFLLTACGRSDMLSGHRASGDTPQQVGEDASPPGGSGLLEHPWPVSGRDPQGTRCSPADTSGNTGKLKWRLTLGRPQPPNSLPRLSSPVISKDGTVYVSAIDHTLYAVAPPATKASATIKWSYTAPVPEMPPGFQDGQSAHPPAIGPDGTVYFATAGTLCALSESAGGTEGEVKWSYRYLESIHGDVYSGDLGSPMVGADGTVYIQGGKLLAFDPLGNGTDSVLKWSADVSTWTDAPPVVARDGTVVFGSGTLMAVQPPVRGTNGTLAWSFRDDQGGSSPAIAADGTMYFGGYGKYVRAVAPPSSGTNGVLKWSYQTDSLFHTAPAIGPDGTVYVAADVYGLFALRPNPAGSNGELIWRWYHGDNQWRSAWPTVGADGTIYLAGYQGNYQAGTGNVHAISPPAGKGDGVLKWVFQTDGNQVSAPAIGADGTVYVTADDTLYAIQ